MFFTRNGQRLDWANPDDLPLFQDIVRQAKANGLTGFGAGPGYMQPGSMHIGFGNPAVWGAGGKGANAPDWLREAYGAAPAGPGMSFMPSGPQAQMPNLPLDMGRPVAVPPTALAEMFAPAPAPNLKEEAEARAEREQRRREALFGGPLLG